MKYKIYSTRYDRPTAEDVDKLFKEYPCLAKYNGRIVTDKEEIHKRHHLPDGDRLYTVEGYRNKHYVYVDIDSIEQLSELISDIRCQIIIDYDGPDWHIEIYDWKREG